MIRTYSQMRRTDKYSQHSPLIWPVWLNGWVIVYELTLQKEQHWLNLLTPNQCKGFQRNKWMPCYLWKLCTYLLWFRRKNPKGMITWALLVFRITNSSPRHLFITTDKTNLHQRAKSRLSTTFKFPKSWENSSTVYFFHIEIWTNL